MKKLLTLFTLLLCVCSVAWGAASTTSDGEYASGTITFGSIGSLSNTTNYWYNGIKLFFNAAGTASSGNSTWATGVTYPAYISSVTSGNKWGAASSGTTYSMSGLACNRFAMGIHVNSACTITVIVDRNIASDTDDAGMTASVDATAYATGWTTSNYATAGTALTVSSTRANKASAPGRYTVTISVPENKLVDGEAVVKMFCSSSGTGSGKLYCFESITVTPATPTLTGAWKIGEDVVTSANVVQGGSATLPTFTVGATSGTPTGSDYNVAYELKDGSTNGIFEFTDGVPTGISTATAGTATVIATLTTTDDTKYLTPATNTFEYTVTVSAASAPTIDVSGAPIGAVKVGTDVTLTATATGVPTPTITWYNSSDEPVATVEGTELAYNVPTSSAGTYTFYAVASNGVAPDATSATQTIIVKEQVATPTFTPNGAYFDGSQSVNIACATEEASIVYSTDNGESWTAFSSNLNITETTTILAKATKEGYIDSETANATFTKVNLEPQENVTGATTWDWSDVTNGSAVDFSGTMLNNVDVLYANISAYGFTAVAGLADQDKLLMNGQRAYSSANDSKHCQVTYLKFNTTVPGTVTVEYANTGNNEARTVNVNGTKGSDSSTANNSYKSETLPVSAGEVLIKGVQVSDDADKMLRIRKVVFTPVVPVTISAACTDGEGNYYGTYSNESAFVVPADLTVSAVGISDGKLVVTDYETGDVVKANTGVMISSTTAGDHSVVLSDETGTDISGNCLKASGNSGIDASAMETAAPGCVYYRLTMHGGTDLGFYYGAEGGAAFALGANKAYLAVPASLAKEGFSFITGEEETDGIKAVSTAVENGVRYNLAGQKVGADYKGIIVVNGKKYVRK